MSTQIAPGDDESTSSRRTAESDRRVAKNRLLDTLPVDTRAALEPHLERVTLEIGDTLARAGEAWSYLYFPEGSAVSLLTRMEDGRAMEIGNIGNEGVVGLPALLGADACEADSIVPIPGSALRAPVDAVLGVALAQPQLLDVVHRYTRAYLAQVAQNAVCNQLHTLEQRCARWVLMAYDRIGGADVIPLKHEYLAVLLGVHRPAITIAMGDLQRNGLISYSRGRLIVVAPAALEAAACECYRTVRQQFDRLVPLRTLEAL